jgi:hypothetical protein
MQRLPSNRPRLWEAGRQSQKERLSFLEQCRNAAVGGPIMSKTPIPTISIRLTMTSSPEHVRWLLTTCVLGMTSSAVIGIHRLSAQACL